MNGRRDRGTPCLKCFDRVIKACIAMSMELRDTSMTSMHGKREVEVTQPLISFVKYFRDEGFIVVASLFKLHNTYTEL